MKRPAITVPDYRADRAKWSGLVQLAHTVAAGEAGAGLSELSEKALSADSCWTNLAPYPRGLVCSVFARIAWAYGRQTDAAARAGLAPLMIASAGMVDELLEATSEPVSPAAVGAEPPVARLPYADA